MAKDALKSPGKDLYIAVVMERKPQYQGMPRGWASSPVVLSHLLRGCFQASSKEDRSF